MKVYSGSLRFYLFVPVCLFALIFRVKAQQSFVAIPPEKLNAYHLNFNQFFSTAETEKQGYKNLTILFTRFYTLKGKVAASAKSLLTALTLWDSLLIAGHRYYIYYDLKYAVDRNDIQSKNLSEQIDADLSEKSVFLLREISTLTPLQFASFVKQEPALKKYDFFYKDQFRSKPHQIKLESEELLSGLHPITKGWQYELYEKTNNLFFESAKTPVLKLNEAKDSAHIMTTADSSLRRAEAYRKYYAGYHSFRALYAFNLIRIAETENQLASIHNFPDAADGYYFAKYHSTASINNILKQIIDSINIYKRYQQARAGFIKKKTGLSEITYWDLTVPVNGMNPKFTIDSAALIIREALSPLGSEYQNELKKLLDPGNGRMEIAPSKTKRPGGFSSGYIGTKSIFYSTGYSGTYNDVRILVHESTHAVHRELMNQNKILPSYASGPNYFFESFAIFSEFLFSDYLIKQAKSLNEKQYYLEKFLEGKGTALFYVAQDALLEQSIHEGVISGSIKNADGLDSLTAEINKQFSIWSPKQYPELNLRWITNSLFYEDPFYEINYVLGAALALKFMELYEKDRASFTGNYIALLKNGFNDEPRILLKRFLNIDINDPALLTDVMKMISKRTAELELLYNTPGE